ncbi:hypothetical protein BP5796_12732 [Coleophoma crateriformis]|uniref:DUF6594 domain-containing protein n=1 Tax=Coleophoma crateriformis TaxID=565419 RepID=A0A3D8Q640_9HELO|nr:hypothetical protein BP5796_12732 [Coleophoma crateriformis]
MNQALKRCSRCAKLETSNSISGSTSTAATVIEPTQIRSRSCERFTKTQWDTKSAPDEYPGVALRGWPKIARLLANNPGFEAFPAFRELSIKSLLYYQAELDELRADLHKQEWYDNRNHPFSRSEECAGRVDVVMTVCGKDDDDDKDQKEAAQIQRDLMKQIRVVLKEYNEALLQYSQITAFPEADCFNLKTLRKWLCGKRVDKIPINGPGSKCWGDCIAPEEESVKKTASVPRQLLHVLCSLFWVQKPEKNDLDLIVPRKGDRPDGLTLWIANELVPFWENLKNSWHAFLKSDNSILPCIERPGEAERKRTSEGDKEHANEVEPTLNTYRGSRMLRFTSYVATLVACLLPTVAITALSQVHATNQLLGLIAAFTAIFAIGLMFLTGGTTSRVEIFTATAAFSAVLVVFMQNQNLPVVTSNTCLSENGTKV